MKGRSGPLGTPGCPSSLRLLPEALEHGTPPPEAARAREMARQPNGAIAAYSVQGLLIIQGDPPALPGWQ
jgi:hypothetical protein